MLVTNAQRAQIFSGVDSVCPLCRAESETITHLLRCIAVSGVWSNPCLNFNIGAGDDIMLVAER